MSKTPPGSAPGTFVCPNCHNETGAAMPPNDPDGGYGCMFCFHRWKDDEA